MNRRISAKKTARPKKKSASGLKVWLALGLPLLLVLCAVTAVWGVYSDRWPGAAPEALSRFLPAAVVNGRSISLYDFRRDVDAYYAASRSDAGISLIPRGVSREAIQGNVLERLIRNAILAEVAKAQGIPAADLARELEAIRGNPADAATLERLKPALGWSDDDLKERLIRVYAAEQQLEKLLGPAEASRQLDEAYNKAFIWRFVK